MNYYQKYIKYKEKYSLLKYGGMRQNRKYNNNIPKQTSNYTKQNIELMINKINTENIELFSMENLRKNNPYNEKYNNSKLYDDHEKIFANLKTFSIKLDEQVKLMFNPELVIEQHITKNKKTINVIRDDFLQGGTKLRGLIYYVNYDTVYNIKKNKQPLIYAGPSQGVAQVALACIGKYYNIKTYMVYSARQEKPLHNMSLKAKSHGIELVYGGFNLDGAIKKGYQIAKEQNGILLPFGLDDIIFKTCLIYALSQLTTIKKLNNIGHPKRLWLVAGSGVILHCMYHIFPKTHFIVLQVGKTIWPDTVDISRTTIIISPLKFTDNALIESPYPSVSSYDKKIWEFVNEYGEDNDYIWNVANELY
jgi:hypothetical protein